MTVATRLKESTRDQHARAERHVRILDADATEATYARYLARIYGFHAAVEGALGGCAVLADAGFDAPGRRKAGWLERDLRALGADPGGLPRFEAPLLLAPGAPPARAVGVAYVLEGSTLGGRYILAKMPDRLRALRGVATRFLEGYRDETGPRWKAFCALAEVVVGSDDLPAAVAGARDTFDHLVAWLDEPARPSPHPFLETAP